MPTSQLVCPHCGHDGTPETSRPPLGSFGFNYLAEGVICREVHGFDEAGRMRLSAEFKCEGHQGAGARVECRSCWRAFPPPEGLLWTVEPAGAVQGAAAATLMPESREVSTEVTPESISRGLMAILRALREEVESRQAARMERIEASLAPLAGVMDAIEPLRPELDGLRSETEEQTRRLSGLADQMEELRRQMAEHEAAAGQRIESLEGALQGHKEAAAQAAAQLADMAREQETARRRMDAQAEVIRALHATAEEQIARREEMKAAVQKLEEIAGNLGKMTPLPEGL